MSLPPILNKLFNYVDLHNHEYIDTLREAVAIPSISACPESRQDVFYMVEWTVKRLRKLGCEVTLNDVGCEKLITGETLPIPPVIFATLGKDPKKKTICIYGHLDVQPALLEDGWNSKPFELTERDGKLYGRGSTDDKGPVLCWLHAIEAYQGIGEQVPVNIKFILESMEEYGSQGLEELVIREKDGYLADIDYVCVSDNQWLGTETPTITYGLRGFCHFYVEVECAKQDLHSGLYGGAVYEALPDLIYLLNTLTNEKGHILIPNILDTVAPLTDKETELYKNINFDVDDFRQSIGCNKLAHNEDKTDILMHRWRYPSLSIHGIEGAFSGSGSKSIIPKKVIGKFSIRSVPDQKPEEVNNLVTSYLESKWKQRNSPNNMKIYGDYSGNSWYGDPFHPNYEAGCRATKHVYGVDPDLTREGGSIPIVEVLQRVLKKNILLLPVGLGDDGAHAENEKINIRNYIEGTKLFAAYYYEVSQL